MVVLVIAGLTLGMVSFSAFQNDRQALQNDAQRIALLMQLARDEAIVRNRPIAFEADSDHYRFLIRDDNGWNPLAQDNLLREREFTRAPVMLTVVPAAEQVDPLRIVFGREPVDKAFVLTLSRGDDHIGITADGIGHYVVE